MFLLRRSSGGSGGSGGWGFTFQYVSIKTAQKKEENSADIYLHSNMFLLRQNESRGGSR